MGTLTEVLPSSLASCSRERVTLGPDAQGSVPQEEMSFTSRTGYMLFRCFQSLLKPR